MASTKVSYKARHISMSSTIHCDRLGEDDGCWGDVRMTGHGYRCEGHRKASGYIEEPVPLTAEQILENARKREEAEAKKEAEYQASRWFRPLMNELPSAADEFYSKLSDTMLAAVFSMIGEGIRVGDGNDTSNRILREMGRNALAEVGHRKLDWPKGYYALKLAPEWDDMAGGHRRIWPMQHTEKGMKGYHSPFDEETLALDLSLLSNDDLMVLYGCAAQVVDYSCLERGARQVCMSVWDDTEKELKRRGLRPEFLMDWDGPA